MPKFKYRLQLMKVYQNPGRNTGGRFLDTMSMPTHTKTGTVEADNLGQARLKLWDYYPGCSIRELYPIN